LQDPPISDPKFGFLVLKYTIGQPCTSQQVGGGQEKNVIGERGGGGGKKLLRALTSHCDTAASTVPPVATLHHSEFFHYPQSNKLHQEPRVKLFSAGLRLTLFQDTYLKTELISNYLY
jgi:hypothetical protein